MEAPQKLQIAVVGAGIAGLAAAIALQDHSGIDIQIYERATELQEVGASIALGPNGMRTLERLGAHDALDDSIAFRNKSGHPMIYRHYKTNEIVSTDSHHGSVAYRHQTARYARSHLQEALRAHVAPTRLHLGKTFQSVAFDQANERLILTFADGATATADILLGADGIHSAVRSFFVPDSAPRWTGWVAFRSNFPLSHVSHVSGLPDEATHYWGPDRTLFVSKLGRDLFTVVGSFQTDPDAADAPYRGARWNAAGDPAVLRELYKDWSPTTRAIIDATPYTRVYPNAAGRGLDSWILGGGRVTLAGDAAHAHGGAFAAGGSLALDDAWAFSAAIAHVFPDGGERHPSGEAIARALRLYETTRKAHTDRVLRVVHESNRKKIEALGRAETDDELRARMKGRHDPAWLHEHDVTEAFRAAVRGELTNVGVTELASL
ncbi:FAD/NAD(P)-binding domain-containing protein [Xylariaceae sp. FL0804]|nr:FAD/NAD(P)-binding domain-containing protein [Xylariaceae sp. FL0804]